MTYSGYWKKPTRTAARTFAWIVLVAGGVLLAFPFWQSSDKGIPGWQPVNSSLQAALSTPPAVEPGQAVLPSESVSNKPVLSGHSSNATPAASASDTPAALDLNAATAQDLDGLPGIGPSKAKTIIAYREAHHGFGSVDELLHVKGIGSKMLDKIRPYVSVGRSGNGP